MSTTFFPSGQAARDEEELALYFFVRTQRDEDDERLFAIAKQAQQLLSDRISGMVPAILGTLFRLRKVEVRRGTVEFWVYVVGGFTLISQYSDFVRSLELLVSQIQNLLHEFFLVQGVPEIIVTGGWTSTSAKRRSRFASFRISQELTTLLLVSYLIASHAVLLVVLVRIALRVLLTAK